MVAKIWTPTSTQENLAEDFRQETQTMLKKVALENKCNVEELKFSVNNAGIVNIQRMTLEEMQEQYEHELMAKKIRKIKELRRG